MATSKSNYELLIQKLDRFIRKFYINKLIRGLLYSIGIVLGLYLLFIVLEYYYYFDKSVRKVFFYSFIGISALSVGYFVLYPLLQFFRLGKVISHDKAASIIGEHFVDVKDKLLNLLQLKRQSDATEGVSDLLLASVDQKAKNIELTPFQKAIDLSKNKKYLRYALPPLLIFALIFFVNASIIKDGTKRIINNDVAYERAAPFSFVLNQDKMEVVQYEDFQIEATTEGEIAPNEAFIEIDGYQYKLKPEGRNKFSYTFKNVQKDTPFRLISGRVASEMFNLDVLEKPDILGFEVNLNYPTYTGRKNESLTDIGDMVVPEGTDLSWLFTTAHTDDIAVKFTDSKNPTIKKKGDTKYKFSHRASKDDTYKVYVSNSNLAKADSVGYSISVIPDLDPTIKVEKFEDSLDNSLVFFVGDASDDYGLSALTFNYTIQDQNGKQKSAQAITIKQPEGKREEYNYTFDIKNLKLQPGDEVSYYFETKDNDAIHGAKSARTQLMNYAVPSLEEVEELTDKNNEEIKDDLEDALKESAQVKKDMKKLRQKLLQEKELKWQDRKELEKLIEKQKELRDKIESAKENFEENMQKEEEFNMENEQLQEKKEKVQEMFEELLSDEMKDMIREMEKLLEKMNKEDAMENMEDMEMQDEQLESELDRMLELFKQLEVESEMAEQMDKLEDLAEETEKLSEETEEGRKTQEELEKKQEEINKKFEDFKKDMEELEQKNKELENPKNMDGMDDAMEDIEKDLDQGQEELEQKQNKKASKSQKSAAGKMQQAAQKMQSQMESGEMEQAGEDLNAIRQLLENLVTLSFEQEEIMGNVNKIAINTPRYVELVQEQYKIKDDFKIVEDSLHALSKRQFQLETHIMEKVQDININVEESLKQLEERKKSKATVNQSRTMRYFNDLALMLSEAMEQMQQQMAGNMTGNQTCQKPGSGQGKQGGKKPQDLKGMQEQLNKDLQKMKNGMKPGGKGMSKEFAEMAKRQSSIRSALEKLQREKQQQGAGGDKEMQKLLEEMNKTEKELVNKKLTNETLKRQQDIMGRLLKSDKADRQREKDKKRKAEKATQRERKMPPALEEYIKQRQAEINMYKTVSPSLKPYYKILVEEYYKKLKGE